MFLTDHKLPLGEQIAGFVDWLTLHGASFFDKISDTLEFLIHGVTNGLLWFNPLVLIALLVGLVHFIQRSWGLTVFALASLLLILNLGYWQETMETLAQVIFATLVCIAVGVPLGIVAAHKPWFYTALRPLLDLMQTVPTFVYLIPTLTLFGLGVGPTAVALVTDFVFADDMALRYSLLLVTLAAVLGAVVLLGIGLKPYRASLEHLKDWSLRREGEGGEDWKASRQPA